MKHHNHGFKFGQHRADGFRFKCVNNKGVEEWLSPEAFQAHNERNREWKSRNLARIRARSRERYLEFKERLADDPLFAEETRRRRNALQAVWANKNKAHLSAQQRLQRAQQDWTTLSLRSARLSSRRRGHPKPSISETFLKELWERQQGRCYWTGMPMSVTAGTLRGSLDRVSVDRLDPDVGYTPENCVLSCWAINRARGASSIFDFQQFLRLLFSEGKLSVAG